MGRNNGPGPGRGDQARGNKRKQWCTLPEREAPEFGESPGEMRSVEREHG